MSRRYYNNNNRNDNRRAKCKFFAQGNCRKGNSCNFWHDTDSKNTYGKQGKNSNDFEDQRKRAIDDLEKHPIWLLSGHGCNKDAPNIYEGDVSPEEVRFDAYSKMKTENNLQSHNLIMQQKVNHIAMQRNNLIQSLRDTQKAKQILGATSENQGKFSNPFGQSNISQNSPFGQPSSSSFGASNTTTFGKSNTFGQSSSSGFGGASTASHFNQAASSPSPFGQASTTSTFGQPSASPAFGQTSTMGNAFGQSPTPFGGQSSTATTFGNNKASPSAFGQAAAETSRSPFGQPSASSSPFGISSSSPSTFGQSASVSGSSPFGHSSSSSFGQTASTISPSPLGQPSSSPSPFAQPQGSSNPSPFGQASNTIAPSPFGSISSSASPFGNSSTSPFVQPTTAATQLSSSSSSSFGESKGNVMNSFSTSSSTPTLNIESIKKDDEPSTVVPSSEKSGGVLNTVRNDSDIQSTSDIRQQFELEQKEKHEKAWRAAEFTYLEIPEIAPPPEFCG